MPKTTGERFEGAVAIMARLRGEGGCPWDREQTFDSIKPYTIEETYEVLEAIDKRDWEELPAELGDLLLQVLFYAQMGKEDGRFSIDDVLDRLSAKLVHRHPHVFGNVQAETSSEVLRNWEAIKAEEKKNKADSSQASDPALMAGVSSAMPALLEAHKLGRRAASAGFDWPDIEGIFHKLNEETAELRAQLREIQLRRADENTGPESKPVAQEFRARLEEEVGDMFFTLVNMARYLSLDSESALKRTNRKFRRRFAWMEEQLRRSGRNLQDANMNELEALWQGAKQSEHQGR